MNALDRIKQLAARPEFNTQVMELVLTDIIAQNPDLLAGFVDRFIPLVSEDSGNTQLVMNITKGLMQAYNGAEIGLTTLPGADALRFSGDLSFAEAVYFDKNDIELMSPILNSMGIDTVPGKIAMALNVISQRFTYRRAAILREVLETNSLTINENRVYISETGLVHDATRSAYHLDIDDTPASGYTDVRDLPGQYSFTNVLESSNYKWGEANSNIVGNISYLIAYIKEMLGREIVSFWIPPSIMRLMEEDSEARDLLKRHTLARLTEENAFTGLRLKGVEFNEAQFTYPLEKEITAAFTVGSDTTITVDNTLHINNNTPCRIISKDHVHKYNGFISSATGTTITLSGAIQGSATVPIGSKVVIMNNVIPYDSIIVELREKTMQYTGKRTSLASLTSPVAGFFTGTEFSPFKTQPYIKVFGGYEGQLQIVEPTFVTMKVF